MHGHEILNLVSGALLGYCDIAVCGDLTVDEAGLSMPEAAVAILLPDSPPQPDIADHGQLLSGFTAQ